MAPAIRPGIATPYATILIVGPALPSAGLATHCPQYAYTVKARARYEDVIQVMHAYRLLK